MKKTIKILSTQRILILMVFIWSVVHIRAYSQNGGGEAYPDLSTNWESLELFSELKFGMFIHWGPVSLRGTEIGWSRGRDVPIAEYDNLYTEFNPVLFDADSWVKTAKDAGMKYIIFTSKHHDGFSMWPSDYTDYDIGSSPFGRDVLQELADACKKYDIELGFYHSIADWHHPHYTTRYGGDTRPVEDSNMDIYLKYLKNQVRELVERYDPFLIWFDGEWEAAWTHEMGMDMYAYLRGIKDDLLINNRVDKGRKGMDGTTKGKQFAGDYATPEQRIGGYDFDNPWETCMTICQQWAWKPNDKMKSLEESLETLIRTVGGGGNLLYNVGPMLDGRFEQRQMDMLAKMGRWIEEHKEAIYGTRGGPYLPADDFVSTRTGQSIYLHILNGELKELRLPIPSGVKVKNVSSLRSGNKLEYKIQDDYIHMTLGAGDNLPRVIHMDTDSRVDELDPIDGSK
ncbi:MAG TPA: alpha-L-fucosidase [Membranihabitans sp.]|nr:alpha-L-fucosidase [Membranihabitans sp.]